MELQFEKNVCRYLRQAVWEVQEQEQTQEIRLTEGMPDVGRVITAWGQVTLRGKEWRGDCITLSGGVMVWVLYAPEDGTEAKCLDAWIPFKMRWDLPDGTKEGDIRVTCLLRSVDARNVSPRKIMVRAGIGARAEAWTPDEAEVYMPGEIPEGVELLRSTYPIRLPREAGEKAFQIDEDLTMPDSCPKPQRIVYCTTQPAISDRKVMADKVVFRGNGNLHILYQSEEGQLHAWDFELPFSQFAELQGEFSPDARVDIAMCVTSLESELDGEGHFRIKCGLVGQYLVDDRQMLELVEDAYSPCRELDIHTQELELPAMLDSRTETVTGEQQIPMDTNIVVDSAFLADFPRKRRTDSGVTMELPGIFQVLCYGENGELRAGSARWEGSISMDADENSRIEADMQSHGRPQVDMGNGTVTLSADLPVKVDTVSQQGIPMVVGLELGDLREADRGRPSLILRRAGEDDLWKLAKRCGSTMDAIRKANGLQEEPESGRILLIPVS